MEENGLPFFIAVVVFFVVSLYVFASTGLEQRKTLIESNRIISENCEGNIKYIIEYGRTSNKLECVPK